MTQSTKTCTLVGSDKGGVGKSMISLIMALAHDKAKRPFRIVEIDHQMKLRSVLGERVDLSLKASADLKAVTRNRHAAESFYNPAYEQWCVSDSVTDLGANVTTSLFDWIKECGITDLAAEDGIAFRFVAVTTPDDQAMRSAAWAIEEAVRTFGRGVSLALVMNDIYGESGFGPYQGNPHFDQIMRMRSELALVTMKMPYCDSVLMDHGKAKRMSPLSVLENARSLAEDIGLDRVSARVHEKKLINWLFAVQNALRPLFVGAQAPATLNAAEDAAPVSGDIRTAV